MGVHVKQPQIARINWNNPLTRGMNFCAVGGTPLDLVNNGRGALVGTVTLQSEARGKVFRTAGGAANRIDFPVPKDVAGSAYSFASVMTHTTTGVLQYLLFRELAGVNGGTINLLFGIQASDKLQISFGTSGSLYGNITIASNTWYTVSGSTPDDGDIQAYTGSLFVNGIPDTLNTTVSGAVQASTSTNMTLNGRPSDNNRQLTGAQALSVSWHRKLSDAEHKEFAKNPWAIFILDDSRTYGVPSGNTTTNQDITGVARIQATTTKTETGVARIQVTTTKTETGLSRIQKIVEQTETGVARITATTTKTETGLSRIQKTVNQTITGVANIVAATGTTTQNITGVSRIQATTIRTETGVSRIQKIVNQTETGLSRIQTVVNKTETGLSRIQKVVNQTETGISRIQATTTRNITGVSRIIGAGSTTIMSSLAIELGGGISKVLTPKGNVLEVEVLTSAPSGAPTNGKGVVFVVSGGILTVYAWDGASWVS